MGIFDFIKHNKIKEPIFYNEHEDERIKILDDLISRVGDDQKEKLEEEKRIIQIGLSGEQNVIYELKRSREPLIFIHDVTIPNGFHDSQIDFIVITRGGILVLETKKLIGDISIDNEGNFTRYFKNSKGEVYKKEGIYSPITQNRYHIDAIRSLLDEKKLSKNIEFKSLVVIANSKTIINKKYAPDVIKQRVIKYDQLFNSIYEFIKNNEHLDISDNRMLEIAEAIMSSDTKKSIDYVSKYNLTFSEEQVLDVEVIDENNEDQNYHLDDELYEKLREYRYNKAKDLNVQPYFIFNNETLSKLVLTKPNDKKTFMEIPGLGEAKYEKFGEDILKLINPNQDVNSESIEEKLLDELTDEVKNKIYNRLKQYRFKKASELNLKPYFIFNNAELDEMIEKLPKNKEELLAVRGFGEKKVELYGKEILDIIIENIK